MKILNLRHLRVWAPLGLISFVGCVDGQSGTKGELRFSQVVDYVESHDFNTPISVGQRVPVAIEVASAPTNSEGGSLSQADLLVMDSAGKTVPVERKTSTQFDVVLPAAGSYRMEATLDNRTDELNVTAREQTALRAISRTLYVRDGGNCSQAISNDATLPVLKKNQSFAFYVAPVDKTNTRLLGVLDLDVTATGGTVNKMGLDNKTGGYELWPAADAASPIHLRVTDRTTSQVLELDVAYDKNSTEPCASGSP